MTPPQFVRAPWELTEREKKELWVVDRDRRLADGSRRLWRCWACDNLGVWTFGYGCFTSIKQMEDGDPYPVWCSEDCRLALVAAEVVPQDAEVMEVDT